MISGMIIAGICGVHMAENIGDGVEFKNKSN
jgi:hypothetical protein